MRRAQPHDSNNTLDALTCSLASTSGRSTARRMRSDVVARFEADVLGSGVASMSGFPQARRSAGTWARPEAHRRACQPDQSSDRLVRDREVYASGASPKRCTQLMR